MKFFYYMIKNSNEMLEVTLNKKCQKEYVKL